MSTYRISTLLQTDGWSLTLKKAVIAHVLSVSCFVCWLILDRLGLLALFKLKTQTGLFAQANNSCKPKSAFKWKYFGLVYSLERAEQLATFSLFFWLSWRIWIVSVSPVCVEAEAKQEVDLLDRLWSLAQNQHNQNVSHVEGQTRIGILLKCEKTLRGEDEAKISNTAQRRAQKQFMHYLSFIKSQV